jgi:hypothetical protein
MKKSFEYGVRENFYNSKVVPAELTPSDSKSRIFKTPAAGVRRHDDDDGYRFLRRLIKPASNNSTRRKSGSRETTQGILALVSYYVFLPSLFCSILDVAVPLEEVSIY